MIYLELFLVFLKIGAVAFGGGYGIIAFIRDECLVNGWLGEDELLNFIAVSESTPGPIAVNMATFVGSAQGGILGAAVATLGVVIPAFIVTVLIATVLTHFLKYGAVKATLGGIRPAIVGLILATATTMFLSIIFSIKTVSSAPVFDYKALIIFGIVLLVPFIYKKLVKKSLSPILLIIFSGIIGVLMYGV